MPRYELIEGGDHGSRKFWEIAIEGASITRRWGRIGTQGQSKKNEFSDPRQAQHEYESLIAEKRAKGYELVEGTGIERVPDVKPARVASNPDLERAIEENPGDEQAWLVYGDWLQSQGDPRGELVALQVAMKRPGITPQQFLPLKKQESELLYDHKAHFEGGIEPGGGLTYDWRHGFVYKVTVRSVGHERLATLVGHPSGRFFQEVDVADDAALQSLAALARPRTLRRVVISAYGEIRCLGLLAKAFPRIERLSVRGSISLAEPVSLPALKSLKLEGGFDDSMLRSRLPSLETLSLATGSQHASSSVNALLEADHLANLRSLELTNIADADGFLARLAKSPLLARLARLEMRCMSLTDLGARAVVKAADRFAHLDRLGLHIELPREVYVPIKKVCKDVDVTLFVDVSGEPRTGKRGEERRRYENVRE